MCLRHRYLRCTCAPPKMERAPTPIEAPETPAAKPDIATTDVAREADIPDPVEDEVQNIAWDVADVIGPMIRAGVATDEDVADMVADRLRPILRQKQAAEAVADIAVRDASKARRNHRLVCDENRKLHDEKRRLEAELVTGRGDYVGVMLRAAVRRNERLQDDRDAALDEVERLRNANVQDR